MAGTAASSSAPSAAVAIRREEIFKRVMIFPGYRFEARIRAVETHRGSAMRQLYARFSGGFNRRTCRSSMPHVGGRVRGRACAASAGESNCPRTGRSEEHTTELQ